MVGWCLARAPQAQVVGQQPENRAIEALAGEWHRGGSSAFRVRLDESGVSAAISLRGSTSRGADCGNPSYRAGVFIVDPSVDNRAQGAMQVDG